MSDDKEHNARPQLDALAEGIRDDMERGRRASMESLEAHRAAGQKLAVAKTVLKRGKYGRWVKKEFNCGKQWSSQLTWLAENWAHVLDAIEWAGDGAGTKTARAKYTPDGARVLVTEWLRATKPEATDGGKPPPVRKKGGTTALRRRIVQLEGAMRDNGLEPPPPEPEPEPAEAGAAAPEPPGDERPRPDRSGAEAQETGGAVPGGAGSRPAAGSAPPPVAAEGARGPNASGEPSGPNAAGEPERKPQGRSPWRPPDRDAAPPGGL